jgi:hypothetical protein
MGVVTMEDVIEELLQVASHLLSSVSLLLLAKLSIANYANYAANIANYTSCQTCLILISFSRWANLLFKMGQGLIKPLM